MKVCWEAAACLALCAGMLDAGPVRSEALPEDPPVVLTAVEPGPGEDRFTLVCEGKVVHRIVGADGGGPWVDIELPNAANAVPPGRLSVAHGPVEAVEVQGGPDDPTRVRFRLRRPAVPTVAVTGRGLEVHLREEGGERPREWEDRPLGTEDLLEVKVFEIPELNQKVRISGRGSISLPLLGEVEAGGLTPRQLEERIRAGLAERYLRDPQVSVFVLEHGSKKVSVLGAVGKPGVYEMLGPRTLLQVLSEAGGLTPEAGADLFVIRDLADGRSERIGIEIEALLASRDPRLNLEVEPGDVISVPADRRVFVYVDGAVKAPGRLEERESRPISLLQAIAKAGGATERANLKKVQVLRQGPDGNQTRIVLNLRRIRDGREPDPVLLDGDVVVVPESFF